MLGIIGIIRIIGIIGILIAGIIGSARLIATVIPKIGAVGREGGAKKNPPPSSNSAGPGRAAPGFEPGSQR